MTITELREALTSRAGRVRPEDCSPRQLLLEEVREAGLPAYFFDNGERLVYVDDQLYDLAGDDPGQRPPRPLPHSIIECGVGVEAGWRHTGRCACRFCRTVRPVPAQDAVA